MNEYIERKIAIKRVMETKWESGSDGAAAMEIVAATPAADVAPVVRGRWVRHYRSGTPVAEGYVSTCCDMWNNRKSDYCPSCGAIMDGGDNDAAD